MKPLSIKELILKKYPCISEDELEYAYRIGSSEFVLYIKIDNADAPSALNLGLERIIDDLIMVLNAYEGKEALFSCQGQGMDGYSALANFVSIAKKARDLRSKEVKCNAR